MNKKEMAKKIKEEKEQKKKIASGITLGMYAVIFIILIVFIRLSNYTEKKIEEERKREEEKYYINSDEEVKEFLKYQNYSFSYTLKLNDITYVYNGKRYNDKEKYQITHGLEKIDVYSYQDLAFIKKGEDYVLSEVPTMYFNFFDSNLINKILTKSKYNEKTEMYEIKTNTLEKILNKESISTNESINNIVISYADKNISSIVIDITNFANKDGENNSIVLLELKYADFNMISDFKIGE